MYIRDCEHNDQYSGNNGVYAYTHVLPEIIKKLTYSLCFSYICWLQNIGLMLDPHFYNAIGYTLVRRMIKNNVFKNITKILIQAGVV